LKCGTCCVVRGHSCHVMYDEEKFNPRYTYVYDCLGAEEPFQNPNIWLCVSCHKCDEMCPYEVSPVSFIEAMKPNAFENGHAHPIVVGEVENVLSTGYAFPLTLSTTRLREMLSLKPIQTLAIEDIKRIAEQTGLALKLKKNKERES